MSTQLSSSKNNREFKDFYGNFRNVIPERPELPTQGKFDFMK